jgi:SagB-type dehydrogenase family enzyme
MTDDAFYRLTELDRATWPEVRDQILRFDPREGPGDTRGYPGYPRWPLDRVGARLWPSLDRALFLRRSTHALSGELPSRRALSRLLWSAHGISGRGSRGPVPSAGGLQALELYLAALTSGWLPAGLYHYDRAGNHLAQLSAEMDKAFWPSVAPSLPLVSGGSLLWILVGDGERVREKYGPRGLRFLMLEAGHLMQNLCLVSASLGLTTVPLGGFFEPEIARSLALPPDDMVLYLGVCGQPKILE